MERHDSQTTKTYQLIIAKGVLKRMGYGFYTVKEKPLLTAVQKKKRLKFARDHLNWTSDQNKFPASIMIWGCMSAQGVGGMQFVDGSINAASYQNLLEENFLPSIPSLKRRDSFIFQQDGASCHTARTTKATGEKHPYNRMAI
ncbi:unnamed protein product [Euphydryas editha]|uniref:Transposase Tc1-like domain-containing protein n=1 Tax=Euphydryas editha TaxID=104508 RepID=A0AAU9UUN8_EUPED|nr:unnamed protein product [Euphydryas editha]